MNYNNNARFSRILLNLCLVGLIATSLPIENALANHVVSARNVDAIQIKQAKSIDAGETIGRLTPKEARRLRNEQKTITEIENDMREDGTLNALELSKLFERLEYAQKHINQLLRNNISSHALLTN